MTKTALLTSVFAILLSALLISCGNGKEGSNNPEAVELGFPPDFPALVERGGEDFGELLTGFGGLSGGNRRENRRALTGRTPVVLLHGNGTPAQEIWKYYEPWLEEAGYGKADVWAVNYLGEGGGAESPDSFRNNIGDVRMFIDAVIDYLGVGEVDVIALSLGCHMARGYILGYQADGSFRAEERRGDRIRRVILISGANYGLGTGIGDDDFNSVGALFDPGEENGLFSVDGIENHTPFGSRISYYTVSLKHDFPHTMYRKNGGGHPSQIDNTSSLNGAVKNSRIEPDEGLGYPDNSGMDGNFSNHRKIVRDKHIFAKYILPHLN